MIFSHLWGTKKFKVRQNSSRNCSVWVLITFDGKESSFVRFNHVCFNFDVESLEQSVKLDRLVIFISALAISFSKHHFFQIDNQKAVLFTVFLLLELFSSCCIVVAVVKEGLLQTPAIVSLANFQSSQMLSRPRLAFDWLSMSFFDYWTIRMSDFLLSFHWINPLVRWIIWKLHLSSPIRTEWFFHVYYYKRTQKNLFFEKREKHSPAARASPHFSRVL